MHCPLMLTLDARAVLRVLQSVLAMTEATAWPVAQLSEGS